MKSQKKNWWLLVPVIVIILALLSVTFHKNLDVKKDVDACLIGLRSVDTAKVAEAILRIDEIGYPAKSTIDALIALLGDERILPETVYNNSANARWDRLSNTTGSFMLPGMEALKNEMTIGAAAASALTSIVSSANIYGEGAPFGFKQTRQDVIEKIIHTINNGSSEAKKDALKVMMLVRDRQFLPTLKQLLSDPSIDVRTFAIGMMITYNPVYDITGFIPALIKLLDDQEESVRLTAKSVLESITGKNFGFSSKEWSEWYEKSRR